MTLESRFQSQSTVNFEDHFPLCVYVISCVSFVFKIMPELRDQLVAGIKPLKTNHHYCCTFSYVCMCKCAPLCPLHLSQGLGLEWVRMTRNECRRLHFLKPSITRAHTHAHAIKPWCFKQIEFALFWTFCWFNLVVLEYCFLPFLPLYRKLVSIFVWIFNWHMRQLSA